MPDEQWDFFLAHAGGDTSAAEELYDGLGAGVRVFLDSRCLLLGDDWDQELRCAQAASRITVVLVSARTDQAYYQREEVAAALDLARHNPTTHRVVPVYLDSAASGSASIPYGLRLKHGLSAPELGGLGRVAEKLLATLDHLRSVPLVPERDELEPLLPMPSPVSPPPQTSKKLRTTGKTGPNFEGSTMTAALAACCFVAALSLLALLLGQAERWVKLGIESRLYYLVLVVMSLMAAATHFLGMRFFARPRRKAFGRMLVLGGPFATFVLTLLGGMLLVTEAAAPFTLTVFVQGEAGPSELPLKNQGKVFLDLAGDRRQEEIGEKGQAIFTGIPANFRGQKVSAWVEADAYETVQPAGAVELGEGSLYLTVRRRAVPVHGQVKDANGAPIEGAAVWVRDRSTTTDASGSFHLKIPGPWTAERLALQVTKPGFQPWHTNLELDSNDIVAQLHREP